MREVVVQLDVLLSCFFFIMFHLYLDKKKRNAILHKKRKCYTHEEEITWRVMWSSNVPRESVIKKKKTSLVSRM